MEPRTFIHYQGAVYLWIELLRETIGNIQTVRIMLTGSLKTEPRWALTAAQSEQPEQDDETQ